MQDLYKILRVTPDATHDQIVKAYRELAKQYYPDMHQGNVLKDLAEEKLKEINLAYEILGNAEIQMLALKSGAAPTEQRHPFAIQNGDILKRVSR